MSKVIVETRGPVRTIWMNRPEKRNALDREMRAELTEALRAPVAAEDRVVVIRGKGTVFCAGLDMAERRATAETGEASGIEEMLRAIELCPLPVVAVVHGDAIAGGNEMALHCDLVLASAASRFGMSLAQVGLAPNWFLAKKLSYRSSQEPRLARAAGQSQGQGHRPGTAAGECYAESAHWITPSIRLPYENKRRPRHDRCAGTDERDIHVLHLPRTRAA